MAGDRLAQRQRRGDLVDEPLGPAVAIVDDDPASRQQRRVVGEQVGNPEPGRKLEPRVVERAQRPDDGLRPRPPSSGLAALAV